MGEAPKSIHQSPGSPNVPLAISGEGRGVSLVGAGRRKDAVNGQIETLYLFAQGYADRRSTNPPLERNSAIFEYTIPDPFNPRGLGFERRATIITPLEDQVAEVFGIATERRLEAAENLGRFLYVACNTRDARGNPLSEDQLTSMMEEDFPDLGRHLSGSELSLLTSELTGSGIEVRHKGKVMMVTPVTTMEAVGRWLPWKDGTPDNPPKQTVDAWITHLSETAGAHQAVKELTMDDMRQIWRLTMRALYNDAGRVDLKNHLRIGDLDLATILHESLRRTEKQLGLDSEGKTMLNQRDRVTAYLWSLPDTELQSLTLNNLAVLGSFLMGRSMYSEQKDLNDINYLPMTRKQERAFGREVATVVLGIGLEAQESGNFEVVQKCQAALRNQPELEKRLTPSILSLATPRDEQL